MWRWIMRKSYRVKKEAEFQKVFETHNSVANRQFVVYTLDKPDQLHFRVGISVGKKIGNAVHRNWVKRRIRQAIFELKPDLRQDVDFIVIARPSTDQMSMRDVKSSLIHVFKLARLLDSNYDGGEKH
ncbi:ribonuclease P protein component [Lentilactobacillus buchneri ATCC 11577]|uniref:Ribonuclease P protein component n=2 Tax=Lentilactobacillus hilgardii TaxID=1588 RepID=C0XII5_LENH9|nr:ribonuclease P protein component [Lentilactobacillus buchneri ATCC 11577]EEI24840.1 ribonuclease P protein component [Lentilactobacillus hilgardii DSM 20176 = ATCC 8290]EEI72421.1 ribonuclease P protein component [Lentilactobacillus hilgardii ATCC 27305]